MAALFPRHAAPPDDEVREASRLNSPPDLGFLIPRKPVQGFPGHSSGMATGKVEPSKGESWALEDIHTDKRSNTTPRLPRWVSDWWLEVLCCVVFVDALMAIVGAILPYQDQPLPRWPYNVSINTLLSILIAIAKAAMLLVVAEGISQLKWTWFRRERPLQDLVRFDMASRGPWGSLRLLLSLHGRDLIASIGAIVTVASIAIDPFTQQVVRYNPCIVWTPSPQASLPRTNSYSEHGAQIYAGIGVIPAGVQSSINAGLFTPGTTNVSFDCPTGNCTFGQEYHTLAFCSSCVDSTPNLTLTVSNVSNSATWYDYSLPSGLSSYAMEGDGAQYNSGNLTLFVLQFSEISQSIEMIINPWPDQASVYEEDYTAECKASKNTSFGCNGVGAATCLLFPCIKTYTGEIRNGFVTETQTSTWTQFSEDANYTALNVDCLDQASRSAVVAQGHPLGPNTHWITYNTGLEMPTLPNGTINAPPPLLEQVVTSQCIYTFSWYTLSSLSYFWTSYFSGNVTEPEGAQDFPVGSSTAVQVIYDTILNNTGNIFANQTGQFQNLSRVFDGIAEALTVHIRQNGDDGYSVPVAGEMGRENTCVHVYWGWLAFPLALVVMTILFLVVMVIRTEAGEQDRFHGWKSSPLALIYHGLDQDTLARHDQGNGMAEMVEDAKDLHVRMSRTDRGWKLQNM